MLALVPRSALCDEVDERLGDRRFDERRRRLPPTPYGDPVSLLRREHARRLPGGHLTRFRVCVALEDPLAVAHAERLAQVTELVVSAYPRGRHRLAAVLRDSGELDARVASAPGCGA